MAASSISCVTHLRAGHDKMGTARKCGGIAYKHNSYNIEQMTPYGYYIWGDVTSDNGPGVQGLSYT